MNWFKERGFFWWLRLMAMSGLIGFNFVLALVRWGIDSADPITKASALLVASGSEFMLGVTLWLFSDCIYSADRGWRNGHWWVKLLWWGNVGVLCMAISLYVNYTYFSAQHESLGDLLVRAGLPMAFLVGFSLLPVKKEITVAQVEQRYAAKIREAQLRQQLQAVLDEPEKQRLATKAARDAAKAKERAMLLDMLAIAQDARIDTQRFYVNTQEGYEWNTLGLQRALEELNLWPPARETQRSDHTGAESVPALETTSDATSQVTPTTSSGRRTMLSAKEIFERWQALGIPYKERTIAGWMEPRVKHPYALRNTRLFPLNPPVRGQTQERRVTLASVADVERKILADRASKVTQLPTLQPTQEPAQEPTRQVTQESTQKSAQKPTHQNAYDLLAAE